MCVPKFEEDPSVLKVRNNIMYSCASYLHRMQAIQAQQQKFARMLQVSVLIVGAGPTGLGAATRLEQHGLSNWLIVDKVGRLRIVLPSC